MHVYVELCLSAHDTVEKDRRSVRGFPGSQRNEGVATAVCGAGHVNMSKDLAKCPPKLRVAGRSRAEQAAPSHGTQARCRGWPRLCGSGTQATRSEGLLWLSSGSRGDADPRFGFGFGLPCLSARSQIV